MNLSDQSDSDVSIPDTASAKWQRVSPVAVFYFLLANIQYMLNLWPALVAALANQHARAWLFTYGVPVLVLIVVGFAFLSYWFFRYQFDGEKIQIRSGIFHKKRLVLNFERVQEANLEQAVYFRPFSLWTLRLESAGSSKEAIALPGISEKLALEIKRLVLTNKAVAIPLVSDQEVPLADYQVQLGITDLIRYGLMHNTLVYLVAIIAPLLSQNEALWHRLGSFVEGLGLVQWLLDYLSSHGFGAGAILVSVLLALFLMAIYSVSILLAIIKYWNYRLAIHGERLQYEAGLFNRVACGFRKHKLQTVIIRQGFIARLLKRYSLEIRQTNEAIVVQGQPHGFVVPVLDQVQLDKLMMMLAVEIPQWQRTSPVQIFWNTLFFGGLLSLAVAVTVAFVEQLSPLWIALPLPIVALWCWRNWYATRYGLTANGFAVRRGLIGHSTVYIPHIKMQKLELVQGPIGRFHGCASMRVWSGATLEHISYVDFPRLYSIHESLLHKVAVHRGRWM